MSATRLTLTLALALGLGVGLSSGGCEIPECIDGPSNLTPEATQACVLPDAELDEEIVSAGAWTLDDGTLVLTFAGNGLDCGVHARTYQPPWDCNLDGYVLTVELPPELAVPGVVQIIQHPDLYGALTVYQAGSGGSRDAAISDGPFFVGEIELTEVGEDCVSGELRGFGTGSSDPTLGGPELDGGFIAPRCDGAAGEGGGSGEV